MSTSDGTGVTGLQKGLVLEGSEEVEAVASVELPMEGTGPQLPSCSQVQPLDLSLARKDRWWGMWVRSHSVLVSLAACSW